MRIHEEENELAIKKIPMNCDKIIQNKKGISVAYPLMKTSHLYLICGPSGSGKTNLVMSMLKRTSRTSTGDLFSYRKMFDNIVFCSPSAHTIKKSPLEHLDEGKKFSHFSNDVIDKVEDLCEDAVDDDKHTLLILDDVSSELRRSKPLETRLNILTKNRRHMNLSIWIVGHKIVDFCPSLRCNASLLMLFKPKGHKEWETIRTEFLNMSMDEARLLTDYIYKTKHDFMLIDTSLRETGDFVFFKNFNKLKITKDENKKNTDNINATQEAKQEKQEKGAEKDF